MASERESINNLARAVQEVSEHYPLPRCEHGQALRDHANDTLEPLCGCRLYTQAQLAAAIATERENCARVVEGFYDVRKYPPNPIVIAAAIRNQSGKTE